MRFCEKHKQEKVPENYISPRGTKLLTHICKKCQHEKALKWKKKNPDKVKAYHKIYQREYYLKNKERILERVKNSQADKKDMRND